MYSNYNNSFENISNLEHQVDINKSTIVGKSYDDPSFHGTKISNLCEKEDNKMTHRNCLLLYLNPDIGSKSKLNYAMNHVKTCSTCKKELTKNNVSTEKAIVKSQPMIQTPTLAIEKYENIPDSFKKYLENIEERIKLNENINKIISLLNDKNVQQVQQPPPPQSQQPQYQTYNNTDVFILIGIVILIILVIIDIVLRIKS